MKFKLLLITIFAYGCIAPPVTKNKEQPNEEVDSDGLENYMEYHRYLREVVNTLENDPEFKKKLEKATEEDIRSGKIAHELELNNNSIEDPTHHHLDHANPHTFEIEDLKKLIAKTTEDLAEADRRRREEFKQYELQKEFEKQEKLNHTSGDDREKLEKEYRELEEKHKKHDKLHEPGHKQQLEEVWEEQDHMQQEFNPKAFFMLHDLDSNGLWDETEVKALFIKELDKMYQAGAPEDDMRERAEEMERMRESVFKEVDTNKDGFIDYNEFIAQTKRGDFQQDHGWQGLDEQKMYTDEELDEYIRQHQMQAQQAYYQQQQQQQHMQQPYGMPPHPNQMPQPGMVHPNQMPPHGMGQMGQGVHPSQMRHPDQMGYQGAHLNHPGQVPPGQYPQYNQLPQQAPQGQMPQPYAPQNPHQQQNLPNLNTNEMHPNAGQVPVAGEQNHVNPGNAGQPVQPNLQQSQGNYQNQPNQQQQGNYPSQPNQQQERNYQNQPIQQQGNYQNQPNQQQQGNFQNLPNQQQQGSLQNQPNQQQQGNFQNLPNQQQQGNFQNPPSQQPNYQAQHQNEIPNDINKGIQH
ncbi:nucleobindin [Holotrichia oblita]|uniref:Nucleobindin n=1 Tax=Holotrichia oblita TaxID=644536 RepID=A0ACB9TSI4_HOLOL|nr:nucleobindin [Holotrichia oblita]